MTGIRQFIYLDEYKMYSLYSQMFEGFSEFVVRFSEQGVDKQEAQKGPIGSGRVLADIAAARSGESEKRYLHDYAYTVFEKEAAGRDLLTSIDCDDAHVSTVVRAGQLIKVTGFATFNDMAAMSKIISTYNELGLAIAYTTTHTERKEAIAKAETAIDSIGDRNSRAKARQQLKVASDIKSIAKDKNLHQDPQFLKTLSELLDFGYSGEFEATIRGSQTANSMFYSAFLKRECLRESESLLVKKFGRRAEGQFSLVGIVAQSGNADKARDAADEVKHLKQALWNMVVLLGGLENTFSGRLDNECAIDPIAIYREVPPAENKRTARE